MTGNTAPGGAVRLGSGGPFEDLFGYSRVVAVGDQAWTAGCTSLVDGRLVGEGDAFTQAVSAIGTAVEFLERAGFSRTDVVHCRMYVVDIAANSDAVGRALLQVLGDVRPAATMLGVSALIDPRMLVEVELVAARTAAPGSSGAQRSGAQRSGAQRLLAQGLGAP